jgi:tetratricopeptide (TPR) repeat protein
MARSGPKRAARHDELKEYRPMTVRSKPLLVLSGVFLVVAVVGVAAIVLSLAPRSTGGILKLARTAQGAGRYADAEIHYKQALQIEPKNAAIHQEFAGLYQVWLGHAPVDKKPALRHEWLDHLISAAKYDRTLRGPRRELLRDAMALDLVPDSLYWAKEVLSIEPENPDAHYVQAADALDRRVPNIPEIRRHLKVLEAKNAPALRLLWVRAKLADAIGDTAGREAAIAEARKISAHADRDPVDLMARMRLAALAVSKETEIAQLDQAVRDLLRLLPELGDPRDLAPSRVARLRSVLEVAQMALLRWNGPSSAESKKAIDRLVGAIEVDLDSIFKTVLADEHQADLQTFYNYADHLRQLGKRERCLEICELALKTPQAARANAIPTVMNLHTIAISMALSRADDKARLEKAAPHIKALLAATDTRAQGLGHLFAGSIDLEQFAAAPEPGGPNAPDGSAKAARDAERRSALQHLKLAAGFLPESSEAQARYGVALVLAGEQNVGRQFLQTALRLGSLDPQYQLWAAWAILQAGYPEQAEPIVAALLDQLARGDVPSDLTGPLHLLRGELYQARRAPEDLQKAAAEFDKALSLGQEATPTVVLRLAQIDIRLKQLDRALGRLDALTAQGKGGPAVEHVAVLALEEQGKTGNARARLEKARGLYPQSAELVALHAALLAKDRKPEAADRVLADFLKREPDNPTLVMMRAELQVESFKQPDRARELLLGIVDRTEDSRPLVQLFGLEMDRNRLDLAAAAVAKFRERWKQSSTADVLDAQLALRRGNTAEAIGFFDSALKKDPDNKIVQFWKGQLASRTGAVAEAAKAFETLVKEKPVKEIDAGLTLTEAAQSALANLSLRTGYYDDAIRRFEELKRNSETGTLARSDRWRLITAYVNRGEWPKAKSEIAAILDDPKNPPSDEDRVRSARFYAERGDRDPALAQLEIVRRANPTHAEAVVTLADILRQAKETEKAAGILRQAIELASKTGKAPVVFYLMLAVVEHQSAPAETALKRALAALDLGLAQSPDADELIRVKYQALAASGEKKAAIELVEAKAKQFPKGPLRRFLAAAYQEQGLYVKAEELLDELRRESPDDVSLAMTSVKVVSTQAELAKSQSDLDRYRQLDDRAESMVRQYRAKHPTDLVLPGLAYELAVRRGDYARAAEITREIDKISSTSPVGPLLRAQLATMQGKPRETVSAYSEALERAPWQLDVRVSLGQLELKLGEPDLALRQAKLVLDVDKTRPDAPIVDKTRADALVLQAAALAESGSSASRKDANSQLAIAQLEAAIKENPRFLDAYHTLAEIHLKRKDLASAIDVLKRNLKVEPRDPAAAGFLVQVLAQKLPDGHDPAAANLELASRMAADLVKTDDKGSVDLAVAFGFHRAGQFDLALPYAKAAAAKLNTPAAHLHYGDLLLTIAEREADQAKARRHFEAAVEEYALVLKTQPNSIEAVNNQAWILHSYLGQTRKALELVLSLRKRVEPQRLPGEFYDTLGAIQEALGQPREAEMAYLDGLKRSPDHPVLNFHFGKLISGDPSRAQKAKSYLNKALAARDRLSPNMAQEADRLIRLIDRERTEK